MVVVLEKTKKCHSDFEEKRNSAAMTLKRVIRVIIKMKSKKHLIR